MAVKTLTFTNYNGKELTADEYLNHLEHKYNEIMAEGLHPRTVEQMVGVLKVDLRAVRLLIKRSPVLDNMEKLNLIYRVDIICEGWGHKESGKKLNCDICSQPLL